VRQVVRQRHLVLCSRKRATWDCLVCLQTRQTDAGRWWWPWLSRSVIPMSAYVIAEVRIIDPDQAAKYMELAASSIARHGGRYLVRGGNPSVPEGQWDEGRRVVVVEFEGRQQLEDWYTSAGYAEALRFSSGLDRRLVFVDGVAG
jgi:uncharacterized protein (DUF1330 family)